MYLIIISYPNGDTYSTFQCDTLSEVAMYLEATDFCGGKIFQVSKKLITQYTTANIDPRRI